MPKKPPRDNPRDRTGRTVQSANGLLQRIKILDSVRVSGDGAGPLEAVRKTLPEDLRVRVVGCVERTDEVVLLTPSAAWAGRVKLALGATPRHADGRRITVRILPNRP